MAVWQASFDVVPHERVAELFPGWFDAPFDPDYVESLPTDQDVGELEWWAARQPTVGFRETLDRLASRIESWSPDVEWWGSEDGDRFDVYSDGGRVSRLYVRFDLRAPSQRFIERVAELAADLNCDFVDANNMLYEGSAAGLAIALRNSAALRFVGDPIAFLEQVRARGASGG